MSRAAEVDPFGLDPDNHNFMGRISDYLATYPEPFTFEDQREFLTFSNLIRELSWDIPGLLTSICFHDLIDDWGYLMYGPKAGTDDRWDIVIPHFLTIHQVDLTNPDINWSFDT